MAWSPSASLSQSGLHSRQSAPGDRHGMFVFVVENTSRQRAVHPVTCKAFRREAEDRDT